MNATIAGIAVTPARIALGSVYFGSDINEAKSFDVMDAYAEAGGNFLDTAHVYAAWLEHGVGASERTIGKWLASRHNRQSILLATKGGHSPLDAPVKVGRCSLADLEKDLGESLERLAVDYVDLYWLHLDEPRRRVEEIIDSLAALKGKGCIRAYGASNWSNERVAAANEYAGKHGLSGFVASQPWFSLGAVAGGAKATSSTSESEDARRRWHLRSMLPMIPYSSQANGYFGAANVEWAAAGFEGAPPRAASFDSPVNRKRLFRAISLAKKHSCSANQIALAYLLCQPFPIIPIIGTSDLEHVREAMGAIPVTLTSGEIESLFE